MATKKFNIGEIIDQLGDMNAEITAANKTLGELKKKKDVLADQLQAAMKEQGISRSGGKRFTATITEEVVAQVADWDKFYAYISRNKAYHLLQKRVSAPAMREVWDARTRPVPGVNKVALDKLSFRKA